MVRVLEGLQRSLDETRRNGVARSVALSGDVIDARTLKVRAFKAIRAGAGRVGLQVVPKTYYSPIPDLDALPPGVFDRRSELRGIHFDLDEQVAWIEQHLASAMREFAPAARASLTTRPTAASAPTCCTASCEGSSRAGSSSSAPATRRCSWPRPPSATAPRASRPSCGRSTRIPTRRAAGPARPRVARGACAAQDVPLEVFTAL